MSYYQKIIDITKDYLGPAAGRFVDRQIQTHLNKPPELLEKTDITKLAIRIRSGLVVLTRDEEAVNEAYQRIIAVEHLDAHSKSSLEDGHGINMFVY